MRCPQCAFENPPHMAFCGRCGSKLAALCPSCGTGNPEGFAFCGTCGSRLTGGAQAPAQPRFVFPEAYTPRYLADRILTSKAAIEGERKQVTVLFADLKGSMELLADRDPEEARKLLDPVLEHMMEAVHRYEGTVNQVMGDGIMALFGAPLAHEDHAVRACYAALRMQESVKRYADEVRRREGVLPQIRVGLNSGEVVVRSIGSDLRMDYTAVGQTTHLAARMEQMVAAGSILLTAETLRLAEGYIEVKPLGLVGVKGLADPVEAFELTGVGAARTRLQAAAARGLTRFVGRDAEVESLRHARAAAAGGHGQVVAVVGEPGVGKSRLFWEFTHSHRTHGWLILESGSVSYGKATPYLPVIDLLKAYFRVGDRDPHRDIREKVTGKLLTLDRALEAAVPALLSLLDVPVDDSRWERLDPLERKQRRLDAVKRLLHRESQVQPLVVVFEDLHWIDAETQAILDALVESLPSARLLLLVNYRPEYQHPWGQKTYYSQLRIDPLPPESADELLHALLGGDASLGPLKRLLIARTEGNPFFIEESARSLVESRVLVGERGAYRLAAALEGVEVPATVRAILAARIDRLPSEDKRLLQSASVIGKDVPLALLAAIADAPEEALRPSLARLGAAEFLYEARLFPELELTFKHALTHEVTYGSLLHDRRRHLHAAIVETMERRYADRLAEHAERLAHHAVQGEVWGKAVTHLWQAGRNARARSAYRQAVIFLEQALEILKRLPETGENAALGIDLLCRDLCDPLATLTQYERLLERLREAGLLAEKVGDRARLADVLARTVFPLRLTGQHDRAVEAGERALALAKEVGDARLSAIAGMELGFVHYSAGDLRRAEVLLRQVLAGVDSWPAGTGGADAEWIRRRTLGALVWVLTSIGRHQEAVGLGEEALRMAQDLGHPGPIAGALGRLGWAHCGRGEVDKAIDLCSRSLALAREREVHDVIQWASAYLGAAHTLAGRAGEAVSCLTQAVAAGESTSSLDPVTLVALGQAYLLAGRLDEASRCAEETLAMCRHRTRRHAEAQAIHLIGDIAAQRDPPGTAEADDRYRTAMRLASELGLHPLVADCHLGLGKLYRRTGKREQAQEHLTAARAMYREMDMMFWLEKAAAEMRELA